MEREVEEFLETLIDSEEEFFGDTGLYSSMECELPDLRAFPDVGMEVCLCGRQYYGTPYRVCLYCFSGVGYPLFEAGYSDSVLMEREMN